ncbi:MAG: LicD family protein [Epulopiscium sp.]|nr:LicD family protein [Candidatus Epulonipiscium sp.]
MQDLRKLHNKILDIVCYFDEICKKNNIEYYLEGGAALGAYRHSGFIPWDDDLDVFMTYDNYMNFISAIKKEIDKEKFYFQEENTIEWPMYYSKLRLNNTTYLEEQSNNTMHKGIYIDIFCLNKASKNKINRYYQYFISKVVTAKTLFLRGYTTKNKIKKIFLITVNTVVNKKMLVKLVEYLQKYNYVETNYYGHLFGGDSFKSAFFPEDVLGRPQYVAFENIKLPVPENIEEYLFIRFGEDFMEIPDYSKMKNQRKHVIFFDTENDYSIYDELEK